MSDLISREAALDCFPDWVDPYGDVHAADEDTVYQKIEALPSAQPMRKKGKWIDRRVFDEPQGKRIEQWQSAKCSVCGKYHTTPYLYNYTHYDFCPSCGAKMEEEE